MFENEIRIVGEEIALRPGDFAKKEVAIRVLTPAGCLQFFVMRTIGHDAVASLAAVAHERLICRVEQLQGIAAALESSSMAPLVVSAIIEQLGTERIEFELRRRLEEYGHAVQNDVMALRVGLSMNEIPVPALTRDYSSEWVAFENGRRAEVEEHRQANRIHQRGQSDTEERNTAAGRMVGLHGKMSDEQKRNGGRAPTHFDPASGRGVWQ